MDGKTKVGINGFGRIGRQVFRTISERHPDTLEVVAINDLTDAATNAHLFKYDSTYGVYPGSVTPKGADLEIDGRTVRVFSERNPADLKWADEGVEIVIESTGIFTDADKAAGHLQGGAKKVIISAPAKGEDITLVLGVNEDQYDSATHNVVSNASCTTNCVAPMAKVLNDSFGIEQALMSTIHAYTNDQSILDQVHSDLRRSRAAANSIIPTTTGAAKAVTLVIPELAGRIDGMAYRVPVITGSVTDLTATLSKPASVDDVNEAFRSVSDGAMKGILGYSDEPLVSVDYIGNPNSCTIDGLSTALTGRRLREGRRLVRQRVGLLEPNRRPGELHSRQRLLTTAFPLRHPAALEAPSLCVRGARTAIGPADSGRVGNFPPRAGEYLYAWAYNLSQLRYLGRKVVTRVRCRGYGSRFKKKWESAKSRQETGNDDHPRSGNYYGHKWPSRFAGFQGWAGTRPRMERRR